MVGLLYVKVTQSTQSFDPIDYKIMILKNLDYRFFLSVGLCLRAFSSLDVPPLAVEMQVW